MGAYSPAPVVTPEIHARVMREIIMPTVNGMAARRHPVHRLPVRRPDDRRQRPAAHARVQLPDGRSRNAADHGARQERPGGGVREGHRRHGSTRPRSTWDRRTALGVVLAAQRLPRRPAQGRRRSPGCRPTATAPSPTAWCSTPAPSSRRARRSPAAVACCASPALGDSVKMAQARAYQGVDVDPLRRACSTAATSAIARSRASGDRGRRSRKPCR